eukprot:TRINITY_DN31125_c0_g1_i1.p1 TRINITY_DN31125_c0_g1~~TRINITY_DN31125_c0_g1_i1.p1  ORF type:complete len:326 (+),score=51.13 TRINITY_DN31125_c0_g1_i1:93-1070(+)
MDNLLEQVRHLQGALRLEEENRAKLEAESARLSRECAAKRAELEEHEQRLADYHVFVPTGDELIELDVGGEPFKTYRSTLMQFEGSTLAGLVTRPWECGAADVGGAMFLDMCPESFREILSYLRERRLGTDARAIFTGRAARLASYLGVPVDKVSDACYIKLESSAGLKSALHGFMFDLHMPGQWRCNVYSFIFSCGRSSCNVQLMARRGSCLGGLDAATGWIEVGSAPITAGANRLELPWGSQIQLAPSETIGVYFLFDGDGGEMAYSAETPNYDYASMSTEVSLSKGMRLVCLPGRLRGKEPFSQAAHTEERFFVGSIEYALL